MPSITQPKINIPPFDGNDDPAVYIEWEDRVELLFQYCKILDSEKVPLATLAFTDYALSWWTASTKQRIRYNEYEITHWDALKEALRIRFVPPTYERDCKKKLQRLVQGSKSVVEYHKEMELLLTRGNIDEDEEQTLIRFVEGLNPAILD